MQRAPVSPQVELGKEGENLFVHVQASKQSSPLPLCQPVLTSNRPWKVGIVMGRFVSAPESSQLKTLDGMPQVDYMPSSCLGIPMQYVNMIWAFRTCVNDPSRDPNLQVLQLQDWVATSRQPAFVTNTFQGASQVVEG
jgi:hypothetical protein